MTDRPILFSAPMVRALLAGTKTQTRRVIRPRGNASLFSGEWDDSYVLDPGNAEWRADEVRFAVGDRLWVKETWRVPAQDDDLPPRSLARQIVGYEADCAPGQISATGKTRVSIFMPRWASRLTLHVTDVRVERLQDISPDDAAEEGAVCDMSPRTFVDHYRNIWERINGAGSWALNPWVVAVTFTVDPRNIGATP